MKLLLGILVAGCLLAPCLVWADLTIETKMNDKTETVYVAPHMLSSSTDEGGVIFLGEKKVLYALSGKDKSYRAITEEDAKALGAQTNAAMSQMQAALANLPPEKRAMVEKMMAGKMAAAAPAEVKRTVKEMGQNKTINGFDCAGYLVTKDDGTSSEIWAADPKAIHVNPADLSVFKDLSEFVKSMIPQMGGMQEMIKDYEHPKEGDIPGFPILTIGKDKDGKETFRAEVVKIDPGKIASEKFEVPSDYTQDTSPMGGAHQPPTGK